MPAALVRTCRSVIDLLLHFVAISLGVVHILFSSKAIETTNSTLLALIFKPLPIYAFFIISVLRTKFRYPFVIINTVLVALGLIFGSFGDIFLAIPSVLAEGTPEQTQQIFTLLGVISFGIGHLLYVAAFSIEGKAVTDDFQVPSNSHVIRRTSGLSYAGGTSGSGRNRFQRSPRDEDEEEEEQHFIRGTSSPHIGGGYSQDQQEETIGIQRYRLVIDFFATVKEQGHWILPVLIYYLLLFFVITEKAFALYRVVFLSYFGISVLFVWKLMTRVQRNVVQVDFGHEGMASTPASTTSGIASLEELNDAIPRFAFWLRYARALGAVIFFVSDTMIVMRQFSLVHIPEAAWTALIMTTYYLGQYLIALSTREYTICTEELENLDD